jgi:hypothetical protein
MADKVRLSRREVLALVGTALLTGALSALGAQAVVWLLERLNLFT